MGMHDATSSKPNREVVESLYASLARGDAAAVTELLAADLDWWFHGPRRCQHMRRMLTGEEVGAMAFRFAPTRMAEVGCSTIEGDDGWVVAEGWSGVSEGDYWVHAWCLHGGVITGLREYFNTSVTAVRELGRPVNFKEDVVWVVWESQSPKPKGRSMPGLVLAI
ncbi:senescence associated gene 20 [Hordeum vulgare subsp. vulgare]|uniref:senescence associated gene 20 n=1 Tax=Hordeum vulgare subsp. vulgare TaxID=112509 RepID=UPI001D1A53AC|nr:senescence associated gene 20 [Hordeum vulgare subsp. vulgare]